MICCCECGLVVSCQQALRGLHHPELRYMDSMKQVMAYLGAKQPALARMAYVKMREECLVIDGRKTGDKVFSWNVCQRIETQRIGTHDPPPDT